MQHNNNPYTKIIQDNSTLVGKGYIYAKKHHLGAYSALKISLDKKYKTNGELYKINTNLNQVITELDFYESYDIKNIQESLFIRKEVIPFRI